MNLIVLIVSSWKLADLPHLWLLLQWNPAFFLEQIVIVLDKNLTYYIFASFLWKNNKGCKHYTCYYNQRFKDAFTNANLFWGKKEICFELLTQKRETGKHMADALI